MNPRILIVEDDEFSRGAMEKLLQSYDYETFSCALAEEAIARLKQESFSLLITDLHMPGMDGFELIRKARMIRPELSTILITGFPTEGVQTKAKEERVDGFFSKPVDWDELYTLLDTLLGLGKIQNQDIPLNIEKMAVSVERNFFRTHTFFIDYILRSTVKGSTPFQSSESA